MRRYNRFLRMSLVVTLLLTTNQLCFARQGTTYTDSRGKKVHFPLGDLSFADRVVAFTRGTPCAAEKYSQPDQILAAPDYVNDYQEPPGYVTTGCGGSLTLQFVDNALVDVEGRICTCLISMNTP